MKEKGSKEVRYRRGNGCAKSSRLGVEGMGGKSRVVESSDSNVARAKWIGEGCVG